MRNGRKEMRDRHSVVRIVSQTHFDITCTWACVRVCVCVHVSACVYTHAAQVGFHVNKESISDDILHSAKQHFCGFSLVYLLNLSGVPNFDRSKGQTWSRQSGGYIYILGPRVYGPVYGGPEQ